ncbi:MAG: hypothetical protein FWG47_02145 [Propionibacteriaceae bacterium]|nr:hypothetical protein [Propionibacteriaceae bacterium]
MTDIYTTICTLQALCTAVRQTRQNILEAISALEHALDSLRALDDPYARNAEADVLAALADLRAAHATWLEEYTRRADDLSRRLAA